MQEVLPKFETSLQEQESLTKYPLPKKMVLCLQRLFLSITIAMLQHGLQTYETNTDTDEYTGNPIIVGETTLYRIMAKAMRTHQTFREPCSRAGFPFALEINWAVDRLPRSSTQ